MNSELGGMTDAHLDSLMISDSTKFAGASNLQRGGLPISISTNRFGNYKANFINVEDVDQMPRAPN